MVIEDPLPLEHGKCAWPCFQAVCFFFFSSRLGARSQCMSITRFFDRALQSPLKRMSQQRFELLYDSQAQGDEPTESNLGYLLEWFVGTGCCAHDIQKSLRRASLGRISAQGLIDMHVIVENLRNLFALLCLHVHQFIIRTVVLDCHNEETDVTAFWQILAVDADSLPSVAFVNPRLLQ